MGVRDRAQTLRPPFRRRTCGNKVASSSCCSRRLRPSQFPADMSICSKQKTCHRKQQRLRKCTACFTRELRATCDVQHQHQGSGEGHAPCMKDRPTRRSTVDVQAHLHQPRLLAIACFYVESEQCWPLQRQCTINSSNHSEQQRWNVPPTRQGWCRSVPVSA